MQPRDVAVPVPVAITTPPQQNLYSPLTALIKTTFPGFSSSCKQKLKPETVKLHVAVLPEISVAVQVTVVVPTGNGTPEVTTWPFWFRQTTVTPGQLSVVVTVKFTGRLFVGGQEAAAMKVMLAGQVIVGGCVSRTVTVKEQLAELFEASLTVHVTVVVPTGNDDPDAGEQLGVPTPGQLSLTAGGGYVTTAEH